MRRILIGTDLAAIAAALAYASGVRRHHVTASQGTASPSDSAAASPCNGVDAYCDYNDARAVLRRDRDNFILGDVCHNADAPASDGDCGPPEFCDCARYRLQREDREGFQDPLSRGAEPGHPMGAGGNNAHWTRLMVLAPVEDKGYELYYNNGVLLGDVIMEVDGYYTFWPEGHGGYWEAHMLRAVADCLDELNEPWDTQIRNDPRIGGGQPT